MPKMIILPLLPLLMHTYVFAGQSNNRDIVMDKAHAIVWQDSAQAKKNRDKDWDDAIEYCDKLVLAGKTHWRLPTFDELHSIVDYTRTDPAINPVFRYVYEGTYWTSTNFSATLSRAWTIDFRTGKTYYSYKTTNHTVRCVKDIPSTDTKDKK